MSSSAAADVERARGAKGPSRRVWSWIAIGAATLVLAFIATWAYYMYWPPASEQAAVTGYRIADDGMSIDVQYTSARDCEATLWARVHESDEAIVVDVAYRGFALNESHDAMARLCYATIPLEAPLGHRVVTDTQSDPVGTNWMDF